MQTSRLDLSMTFLLSSSLGSPSTWGKLGRNFANLDTFGLAVQENSVTHDLICSLTYWRSSRQENECFPLLSKTAG